MVADITVAFPIERLDVELRDTVTNSSHLWHIDHPTLKQSGRIRETLIAPPLPPGSAYQLHIIVVPQGSDTSAVRHSIPIRVGGP